MSIEDQEHRPTDMVLNTLRAMFVGAHEENAAQALENGNGPLVVEIAHLIDATAATSFAKGLRRAIAHIRAHEVEGPIVDRLEEILRDAEAVDARKGYPGRVSTIDPDGKILLFQVDGSPEEVRPLARHLREALDPGGVVVVLPVGSTLEALDGEALRKAGLVRIPTPEEVEGLPADTRSVGGSTQQVNATMAELEAVAGEDPTRAVPEEAPTDTLEIPHLDAMMGGGLRRGEMGVVLAPPKIRWRPLDRERATAGQGYECDSPAESLHKGKTTTPINRELTEAERHAREIQARINRGESVPITAGGQLLGICRPRPDMLCGYEFVEAGQASTPKARPCEQGPDAAWLCELLSHTPIDPYDDEECVAAMLTPFASLIRMAVDRLVARNKPTFPKEALDRLVEVTPVPFLDRLRAMNVERCEAHYHALNALNVFEWAGAVAGEAGEAANVAKKLHCREAGIVSRKLWSKVKVRDFGEEIADTIIYADLALARVGLDLTDVVRRKFNSKSRKLGYERVL